MRDQFYTAMESGDIARIKSLISEGYKFCEAEQGYYSPFTSAIKGYHVANSDFAALVIELAPKEVLEEYRWMIVEYGHLEICQQLFGLSLCPNAMAEAERFAKYVNRRNFEYFEADGKIGIEAVVYTDEPSRVWDYLKTVYHNGEKESLADKRYSGSSPYSPHIEGSGVCYWREDAWDTRIGVTFCPGEYRDKAGEAEIKWTPSPLEKPSYVHPFDAGWDLFPAP